MSETPAPAPPKPPTPPPTPPRAKLRRPRFQLVWLIPIVAAILAGYLGYRTLIQQGPILTLTFTNADSLATGQTQLKYKAVAVGTVESIDLAPDNSHVVVQVRMNNVGARFLTSHARFWVERPRFNLSDISGIETLVSGAYITVDPGAPGGHYQNKFAGLEEPPGVRSDEPGSTYVLTTNDVGSLSSGSPVYYRDVQVGEVLDYNIGNGLGPVHVSVFIRAPFNNLVRPDSRFWNVSGISLGTEGGVLQLQLQSVQALLAGGISFAMPDSAQNESPCADGAIFPLYHSQQASEAAAYHTQIQLVTYFTSDVSGLTPGSPVEALGLPLGQVTAVQLQVNAATGSVRVRVAMQVQPQRLFPHQPDPGMQATIAAFQQLVQHGLHAELATASYVTGQKEISLSMAPASAPGSKPGSKPAALPQEGDALVLPSAPGGFDQTIASLNAITAKINQMPLQQIGDNLNKLLITANGTLGGKPLQQSLAQLAITLHTANTTLQGLNQGFGTDSDFQRNLEQLLQQTNTTAQSVQTLSDYLNRHPQALLLGRTP